MGKTIQISNWDNFQRYRDGRKIKWVKLYIDIIDEFDEEGNPKKFINLPDSAKLTFLCLLCLKPRYVKIPYKSDKWLANQLGIKRVDIQPLENAGYITIETDLAGKSAKSGGGVVQNCAGTLPREGDRDREGDREKEKHEECVYLTTEQYKKLCERSSKVVADRAIEILNNYKMSKGKVYRSDYHAILNWALDKAKEASGSSLSEQNKPIHPEIKDFGLCECGKKAIDEEEHLCRQCFNKKYPPPPGGMEAILKTAFKKPWGDEPKVDEDARREELKNQAEELK